MLPSGRFANRGTDTERKCYAGELYRCAIMSRMRFNHHRRALLQQFEKSLTDQLEQLQDLPARMEAAVSDNLGERSATRIALTAAWITGAVAVLAAGLYAGKQLRSRYTFKRRTPYDYYAHSGDRSDLEFGVGI